MFANGIPTQSSLLPWREIDGRAVIIQPRQGEVHELDTVGTFIWTRVNGSRSVAEIASELMESFEVDLSQAETDVREFLAVLAGKDLITWGP